jgi:redox-sensitive bicupin YhaK (pirin superfamily)
MKRQLSIAAISMLAIVALTKENTMKTTLGTIAVRKADERGVAEHGWLHSRHSFSFADYYDPDHTGFHTLRVINDDRVEPSEGFGTHPHKDMEIISYVVEGALEHKDSMGNGSIIRPHDVQRMSAGTGIQHSEYNPESDKPVHFLQIWITPAETGVVPSYEQKRFPLEEKLNRLCLVVSSDGSEGSVSIGQDARLYAAVIEPGHDIHHTTDPKHRVWVQVVKGGLTVNGETLNTGDGAAIENAEELVLTGIELSEVLVFDLA